MVNSTVSHKEPMDRSTDRATITKLSLQDALNVLVDALERGAENDAARLRDEIMGTLDRGARPQLLKLVYKRGIECLKSGNTAAADGLLTWLRQCDPVSLKANLAEAAVVQVLEGPKAATELFREFVSRRPIHRIQAAKEPGLLRAGTLMCIGEADLDFVLGGFTLPSGHSESQHLFAGADHGNVFVFCDGLTGYELGGFDVLFNAISDPDVFGAKLRVLADTSETVINRPEQCLQNTRDWLSDTFANEVDFIVPKTVRVAQKTRREDVLSEHALAFPLLMRPVGSQTGEGLVKFDSAREFKQAKFVLKESYLTEFHDFCSEDSFYRKYRCWWIGGTVVPNHLFAHTHWKVHSAASRLETMADRPTLQAEEKVFLADTCSAQRKQIDHMMEVIAEANGLDYFGVDFSFMPDGKIVVFEANATMRSYYPEYADSFAYLSKPATAHVAAFQKLVSEKAGR